MTDPSTCAKLVAELESEELDTEKPGWHLDVPMQGEHATGFNQFYKLTARVPPKRPSPSFTYFFFKGNLNEKKAASFWMGIPCFPAPLIISIHDDQRELCLVI